VWIIMQMGGVITICLETSILGVAMHPGVGVQSNLLQHTKHVMEMRIIVLIMMTNQRVNHLDQNLKKTIVGTK
jgi:hypothetical protein